MRLFGVSGVKSRDSCLFGSSVRYPRFLNFRRPSNLPTYINSLTPPTPLSINMTSPDHPEGINSALSHVWSQRLESAASQTPQTPPDDGATYMATDAPSELEVDDNSVGETPPTTDQDEDDNDAYDGIDWTRLPDYHKPGRTAKRSRKSWVWRHGYRLWHRKQQRLYWLCHYCHRHKHPDGFYQADQSTTSIARHLGERKAGHGVDKNGRKSTSRITMPASQQSSCSPTSTIKALRYLNASPTSSRRASRARPSYNQCSTGSLPITKRSQ